MLQLAHHDYETAAPVSLKATGAAVYADYAHPICLSWTLTKTDEPKLWTAYDGTEPTELLDYIENGGLIAAWNTNFEENIWWRCIPRIYPRWPRPRPEQFHDIMAWAYAAALPGGLDDCAAALGVPLRKLPIGNAAMKVLSKPREIVDGKPVYWQPEEAPEKFAALYDYNKNDSAMEREIAGRLRPLSDRERKVWLLDQKINHRGLRADMKTIHLIKQFVADEKLRADEQMRDLTGGAVKTASNAADLVEWCNAKGVKTDSVKKSEVDRLLDSPTTPEHVKAPLRLRQDTSKSSLAKIGAIVLRANPDGILRGLFQYHQATTGRWGGRNPQPQNMVRPEISAAEVQDVLSLLREDWGRYSIEFGYGACLTVLSWCLRGLFIPSDGCRFVGGDFANIEGRVLVWLANEEWKLDAFRDRDAGTGMDLYILAYARAFGLDPLTVSAKGIERQIGKVIELALGYQGGVGAIRSMAATYHVDLEDIATAVRRTATPEAWAAAEKKRLWLQVEHGMQADLPAHIYTALRVLVDAWRSEHPQTKQLWRSTEEAALSAVLNRGTHFKAAGNKVSFVCGQHFLYCRLPSGRLLSYSRPSVEWVQNKFTGKDQQVLKYFAVGKDKGKSGGKKKYEAIYSFGGLLTQNIDQAVSRDVLADAMLRLEDAGYPIALHVHDEIRCDVPNGFGSVNECRTLMEQNPEWADGLPLFVEAEEMRRYHK
jgi:DNA polymerase bacteriophage-type